MEARTQNTWKSTAIHDYALGLEHPFDGDDGDQYGTTTSTSVDQTLMAYGQPASGIQPTTVYSSRHCRSSVDLGGGNQRSSDAHRNKDLLPQGNEDITYQINSSDLLGMDRFRR